MSPRGYGNPLKPPASMDAEAVKKRAWIDQRILVVSADDPRLPWQDRYLIEDIASRLFPKRKTVADRETKKDPI